MRSFAHHSRSTCRSDMIDSYNYPKECRDYFLSSHYTRNDDDDEPKLGHCECISCVAPYKITNTNTKIQRTTTGICTTMTTTTTTTTTTTIPPSDDKKVHVPTPFEIKGKKYCAYCLDRWFDLRIRFLSQHNIGYRRGDPTLVSWKVIEMDNGQTADNEYCCRIYFLDAAFQIWFHGQGPRDRSVDYSKSNNANKKDNNEN